MPRYAETGRIMQGIVWLFLLEFLFYVRALQPGFLDFDNLPDTNFSCIGKVIGGYYADLETNCQMFHVCTIGQLDEPMDIRFLCLNGTVFDQETRVCERIDEVDCTKSEKFYSLNLELYGNTQPAIAEESSDIELPIDIQKTTSLSTAPTTPTTTTTTSIYSKSTRPSASFSTSPTLTSTIDFKAVITSHHFPIPSTHDVLFDPEEININSATPDSLKVPISYQQQTFEDNEKRPIVTVTTHTENYRNDHPHRVSLLPTQNPHIFEDDDILENPKTVEETQTPKSVVSYDLTHHQASPTEINYGFTNIETEHTRYQNVNSGYSYKNNVNEGRLQVPVHPYVYQFQSTTKRTPKFNFPAGSTYKNQPLEKQFNAPTKKPSSVQLPSPPFPTLPPISFSSPTPFGFGNHIETKRYTSDHHSPPRIIISASASVSDNNGRRLNYSLGTIGAGHILASPPTSYDEYKEEDVALDPFYHDVPKVKTVRRKRSIDGKEEDSDDVLKFLFDWYLKRKDKQELSIPIRAEDITQINEQFSPVITEDSSEGQEINRRIENIATNKQNRIYKEYDNFRSPDINENYPRGNFYHKPRTSKSDNFDENDTIGMPRRNDKALDGTDVLTSVYEILGSAVSHNLHEKQIKQNHNTKNETLLSFAKTEPTSSQSKEIKEESNQIKDVDNVTTEGYAYSTDILQSNINNYVSKTSIPSMQTRTNTENTFMPDTTIYDYYEDDETNTTGLLGVNFSTVMDKEGSTPSLVKMTNKTNSSFVSTFDYVDDNYEPLTYTNQPEQPTQTETETIAFETTTEFQIPSNSVMVKPKDYKIVETLETNSSKKILSNTSEEINTTTESFFEETIASTIMPDTTTLSTIQTVFETEGTTFSFFKTVQTTLPTKKLKTVTTFTLPIENTETTTFPSTIEDTTFSTYVDTVKTTENTGKFTKADVDPITSKNRNRLLKAKVPAYRERDYSKRWEDLRHRFSSLNRRKGVREKEKAVEETRSEVTQKPIKVNISMETSSIGVTDFNNANLSDIVSSNVIDATGAFKELPPPTKPITGELVTNAPLSKSAIPTKTKNVQLSVSTTPITKLLDTQLDKEVKRYSFSCFDKKLHYFYSDLRDCRLFHYCTLGYKKNQLVDMKFVCDLGTYFDEEKVICSETKPSRCM